MTFSPDLTAKIMIFIPLCAAALLALQRNYQTAIKINIGASALTFLLSLLTISETGSAGSFLLIDKLNSLFVILVSFMGFTTSIYSANYIAHEVAVGRLGEGQPRFFHTAFQIMLFAMNLALLANNIGVMWVAIETATLSTVLMVGLYRTNEALEAAWKYFILASVGIALALFGTILVYTAAEPVIGEGFDSMLWSSLMQKGDQFNPHLLNIAFVFLLVGYGTKVGLVPLHAWLPDAHAEGPTPISAVLSGLLLNVALYTILRFKMLMNLNAGVFTPGPILISFGVLSVLFAALMLYRKDDVKRLFAFSSIEHMGIIVFAFGVGGIGANFGALLHMVMHSLTKSAIFFSVGYICQIKATQKIADIRGISSNHPFIGWSLVFAILAILGLPPFGVFMSEFLIITAAYTLHPILTITVVIGLLIAFGAISLRMVSMAFGEATSDHSSASVSVLPIFIHMAIVLVAGLYLPATLVSWFQGLARTLG